MIIEAFHGAPYSVYACFDGSRAETIDNIHFLQSTKAELLPGSIACIHDGNDYFTNQCLARGIQQLIITNHDYIRLLHKAKFPFKKSLHKPPTVLKKPFPI